MWLWYNALALKNIIRENIGYIIVWSIILGFIAFFGWLCFTLPATSNTTVEIQNVPTNTSVVIVVENQ